MLYKKIEFFYKKEILSTGVIDEWNRMFYFSPRLRSQWSHHFKFLQYEDDYNTTFH